MIEELLNNKDTLIAAACIVLIVYCAFDIAIKIGQLSNFRRAEKQIKHQVEQRSRMPEPEKEPSYEEQFEAFFNEDNLEVKNAKKIKQLKQPVKASRPVKQSSDF